MRSARRAAVLSAVLLLAACEGSEPTLPTERPADAELLFAERTEDVTTIYRMKPDGTGRTALHGEPRAQLRGIAWSPDYRRVAVAFDRWLALMNPDGSGFQKVFIAEVSVVGVSWTPDGKRLATTSCSGAYPNVGCALVTVRTDGTDVDTVYTSSTVVPYDAAVSPDGRRIAFVGERTSDRQDHIYTVRMDGKELRDLTPAGFLFPSIPVWSPDGTTLLFGDEGSLWTVRADGTALTRVAGVPGHSYYSPAWAPDGGRIAFFVLDEATSNLRVALSAIDGTGLTHVSEAGTFGWLVW